MKKNKLALISALALTLVATPAIGTFTNSTGNSAIAQAATTKGTAKLIDFHNTDHKIPVFNKNGKRLSKTLASGSSVKAYGNPVILKGPNYHNQINLVVINGKDYFTLGDGYISADKTVGTGDTIDVLKGTYVVDKNGKRLRSFRGKSAYVKAKTKIKVVGTYNVPAAYVKIGNNQYVKASYVTQLNGKSLITLNSNSYIYNKKGQRIRNFHGQSKLLKNAAVITTSKVKKATDSSQYYFYDSTEESNKSKSTFATTKIKGVDYFAIGNGGYIKASNVIAANGMILFTKGPITIKLPNPTTVYTDKFKETTKKLKAGTTVKLDKSAVDFSLSDPQLYFHVAGTKQLIYWGDAGEYPGYGARVASYDRGYADNYAFSFKQFME